MNDELKYEEPDQVSHEEATRIFRANESTAIASALVGLAIHDHDAQFTLLWCMFFLGHPDDVVAGAAAISIGHIARIHKHLNVEVVVPLLQRIRDQGRIVGHVSDALDDIAMYLPDKKHFRN